MLSQYVVANTGCCSPTQASKDIVRVVEWKDVECFTGSNYKKFFRAPGPHCFSLVVSGLK